MKTKILASLLLVLLLSACQSAVPVVTPTVIPLPLTPTSVPSPTPLPVNQVTFQTEDGVRIAATLYGAGKIAVILAHQGTPGADQTTWRQFATTLAENGFTAMTFDFRGAGQSGGTLDYALLDRDVRGAVQYLHDQQYHQIVCAGASMGGMACLRVAIDDKPFIGLILLASTMTAGRSNDLKISTKEMNVLTEPKLFITAKNDSVVVVQDTHRMYDLSPEPKELLLLDGTKHGTSLFQTEVAEKLSGAMLDFLKALPSPTVTLPSTRPPLPAPAASPTPASSISGSGVIAFLAFNPDNPRQSEINVMNADGSSVVSLPNTSGAAAVAWSPNGKWLAFIVHHNDNDWSMYVVNADGTNRTRLTQGTLDHFPQWSPDGRQIAFSRNGNIWVMNFSTEPTPQVSALRQLTTDPKEYASAPVWSSDGKQIAFASQVSDARGTAAYNDPNTAEIYVINADGSSLHKLADNQTIDLGPGWSPDGHQIAFSSNRDGSFQIYVMDADGSHVKQLTTGTANNVGSAWSPDGTQIAFSSDRDGKKYHYQIYLMNADGSHQTRLTNAPLDESSPVWKPAATASASSTDLVLKIPESNPPALDGVLSPDEWAGAVQEQFIDGGKLLLMQSAGYLYLGLHENFDGLTITSVCLEHEGEISILHSSGSLGTAIFKRNDTGWQLTRPFEWDLYGITSNTPSAGQQRKAFLQRNGWLANLGSMTATEEIEYQIAIPDGPFRITVAYLIPPDSSRAVWWPAGLADDCRKITLLQANIAENLNTPLHLQFSPENWVTITASGTR